MNNSCSHIAFQALEPLHNELFEVCRRHKEGYQESDLWPFFIGVGRNYNEKLLIVGRAPNGWTMCFDKNDPEPPFKLTEKAMSELESHNLDWVDALRGENESGYNTNRSAFWRVSRLLANHIACESAECINYIGYSNLYKIAPEAGNPSTRLMNVQFEQCVKILQTEIKLLKPKNVVFLTGFWWAGPFIERLITSDKIDTSGTSFIEFASRSAGINYIVGQHPQGKPEQEHFQEIVDVIDALGRIEPNSAPVETKSPTD